jgi:hypothetical protein
VAGLSYKVTTPPADMILASDFVAGKASDVTWSITFRRRSRHG